MDVEVLEGWKSSGRPVGNKSSNPGTLTPPWCRVMARKPNTDISDVIFRNIFQIDENYGFSIDFGVLEGWKSSGRPVGKMSTKWRPSKPPWSRVMTKQTKSERLKKQRLL